MSFYKIISPVETQLSYQNQSRRSLQDLAHCMNFLLVSGHRMGFLQYTAKF